MVKDVIESNDIFDIVMVDGNEFFNLNYYSKYGELYEVSLSLGKVSF